MTVDIGTGQFACNFLLAWDEINDILKNNYASYSIGNQISSQVDQIVARDKIIGTSVNPTPLIDILINWLNNKQDPNTGAWIKPGNVVDFDALNGVFKIISIYNLNQA